MACKKFQRELFTEDTHSLLFLCNICNVKCSSKVDLAWIQESASLVGCQLA